MQRQRLIIKLSALRQLSWQSLGGAIMGELTPECRGQ